MGTATRRDWRERRCEQTRTSEQANLGSCVEQHFEALALTIPGGVHRRGVAVKVVNIDLASAMIFFRFFSSGTPGNS